MSKNLKYLIAYVFHFTLSLFSYYLPYNFIIIKLFIFTINQRNPTMKKKDKTNYIFQLLEVEKNIQETVSSRGQSYSDLCYRYY
jgi:hypothetical protein